MATFYFKIHLILYILIASPLVNPFSFSFNGCSSWDLINMPKPNSGDAFIYRNGIIDLTKNSASCSNSVHGSCGWVSYKHPIPLKDPNTGQQATFVTHFSFKIDANLNGSNSGGGDGLAFFMSPYPHIAPTSSCGDNLGLYNNADNMNTKNQLVVVEFDTFMNPEWDYDDHHIGINVNTIKSVVNQTLDDEVLMKNGTVAYAWITYYTQTLSVYLTYEGNGNSTRPTRPSQPILSYQINLTDILPNEVVIGFSAAAGTAVETHQILTWDFNLTFDIDMNIKRLLQNMGSDASPSLLSSFDISPPAPFDQFDLSPSSSPSPFFNTSSPPSPDISSPPSPQSPLPIPDPPPSFSFVPSPNKTKSRLYLRVGIPCLIGFVILGVLFIIWKKKSVGEKVEEIIGSDQSPEDFGRKHSNEYTYENLAIATSDFSDENKLGEGGFGPVFKGVLRYSKCEVAVKRVSNSKRSEEALKEYKSEVKILSESSHRNIIKLEGWCEEKGELLLVYKFMPNGSFDSQLYNNNRLLTWPERYNIARGLASGLNYLHEECERYILHRDIKPGNVLLDSNLEAKLSDFGLARLVDHNHTSQTATFLAGTRGYLAPEFFNGERVRMRKESDIYSFGVVLLEMACGRRPYGETSLVDFVWDLYWRRDILQAADKRLNGKYDAQEMQRMLIVGLWCVQWSYDKRPKISEAISALKHNSELPNLPSRPTPIDHNFPFQKILASSSNEEISSLDHLPLIQN